MEPPESSALRERTRLAVRAEISDTAIRLFLEHGFDNTSVEQIAAVVGISSRSFFRYFKTKEEVVLGNLAAAGVRLQHALEDRPSEEEPWVALRSAFDVMIDGLGDNADESRRIPRMLVETPSLRARHLEKQLQWQELLVPNIEQRLPAPDHLPDARAHSLVAAALSCLDAAIAAWALSEASVSLGDILDESIAAVRR